MNDTMKAISQNELGGPEVLKLVTLPTPAPGLSEILIRVHAAGVNPIDTVNRQTGALIGTPPFVLGWDVSGTVEAVGPGVTLYKPGDDVFGMLPFPQGHGVNAAAGGIGHLAVQIAKARGAYVTALASAAHTDFVRSLGADEVIDYARTDFTQAVKEQDVVLEVVGGDYPGRAIDVLKPGGTLVSTQPPSLEPVAQEASKRGVRLAGLYVEADEVGMSALADLAAAGELTPTVSATFPLEKAGAAEAYKNGPGKVVLTVM